MPEDERSRLEPWPPKGLPAEDVARINEAFEILDQTAERDRIVRFRFYWRELFHEDFKEWDDRGQDLCCDWLRARYRLHPDLAAELEPHELEELMSLDHEYRHAPTEQARQEILRRIAKGLKDPGNATRAFLDALRTFPRPAEQPQDDPDYQPASAFPKAMREKIKKAAARDRIRKTGSGRNIRYSAVDVRKRWKKEMEGK